MDNDVHAVFLPCGHLGNLLNIVKFLDKILFDFEILKRLNAIGTLLGRKQIPDKVGSNCKIVKLMSFLQ